MKVGDLVKIKDCLWAKYLTFKIDKIIENNIYLEGIEMRFKPENLILVEKNNTQEMIDVLAKNFAGFLKEKNKRYGDSALNPAKIFSKHDNSTISVRIDDKLSRIMNASELKKNDVADLYGYISLLMIQNGWTSFDEMLD